MSNTYSAGIPKVLRFQRTSVSSNIQWENRELNDLTSHLKKPTDLTSPMYLPVSSKKLKKETNIQAFTSEGIKKDLEAKTRIILVQNAEFTNVKIASLYLYSECAYIGELPNGLHVPLGAEIVMSAIASNNHKGNLLTGSYTFARINKHHKLVEIGSPPHKIALEADRRRNQPTIDTKELEVGQVYSSPGGAAAVFLGYVSTISMRLTDNSHFDKNKENGWVFAPPFYSHTDYEIKVKKVKLATLWVDLMKYQLTDEFAADATSRLGVVDYSTVRLRKRHSFIEKTGNLKKCNIDLQIVQNCKLNAIARLNRQFTFISKNRRPKKTKKEAFSNVESILDFSNLANMTVFGMEPEIHEAYDYLRPKFLDK